MKFLALLFTLFLSLGAAHIDDFAQEMGYERDYATALALAKDQNKTLMLVVVGDTCPWCRKFERKTLMQEVVDMTVKADFIPLIIDRKHDEGTYPEIYNALRIPTVYFISETSEKQVYESMGYVKIKDYIKLLVDIKKLPKSEKK
ncbi:MAG: thioredoxin family protein [Sulfurimonadaceae bacterium]|jgi:thioredoxin-related protein|nr:thioredoxin family protein [Sulfurimonadaceae bacterium]